MKFASFFFTFSLVSFSYCMEHKKSVRQPFSLKDQSFYQLIKTNAITPETLENVSIPDELTELFCSFYSAIDKETTYYKTILEQLLSNYKSGKNVKELAPVPLYELLMSASRRGNKDIVKFLLFWGVNVNDSYHFGDTALMWAADNNQTEIVTLLIAAGVNLNAQDHNKKTALNMAMEKGHVKIISILQQADAQYIKTEENILLPNKTIERVFQYDETLNS